MPEDYLDKRRRGLGWVCHRPQTTECAFSTSFKFSEGKRQGRWLDESTPTTGSSYNGQLWNPAAISSERARRRDTHFILILLHRPWLRQTIPLTSRNYSPSEMRVKLSLYSHPASKQESNHMPEPRNLNLTRLFLCYCPARTHRRLRHGAMGNQRGISQQSKQQAAVVVGGYLMLILSNCPHGTTIRPSSRMCLPSLAL